MVQIFCGPAPARLGRLRLYLFAFFNLIKDLTGFTFSRDWVCVSSFNYFLLYKYPQSYRVFPIFSILIASSFMYKILKMVKKQIAGGNLRITRQVSQAVQVLLKIPGSAAFKMVASLTMWHPQEKFRGQVIGCSQNSIPLCWGRTSPHTFGSSIRSLHNRWQWSLKLQNRKKERGSQLNGTCRL